jgi:hypothetical protein
MTIILAVRFISNTSEDNIISLRAGSLLRKVFRLSSSKEGRKINLAYAGIKY